MVLQKLLPCLLFVEADRLVQVFCAAVGYSIQADRCRVEVRENTLLCVGLRECKGVGGRVVLVGGVFGVIWHILMGYESLESSMCC